MRRGFTLLELILVLALILVIAAIVWPSIGSAFSGYYIERAAEDLQTRLMRTRLDAIDQAVPYAFSFRPESDQFFTWTCEPLVMDPTLTASTAVSPTARESGDAYDRRYFQLNQRDSDAGFRFLSAAAADAIPSMGVNPDADPTSGGISAQSVAASTALAQTKLGLVNGSPRSIAALTVPGMQLGDAADPIIFEPDGSADKDAVIRIADRSGRYVEIRVQGVTGAIRTSPARMVAELSSGIQGSAPETPRTGLAAPGRSREIRTLP